MQSNSIVWHCCWQFVYSKCSWIIILVWVNPEIFYVIVEAHKCIKCCFLSCRFVQSICIQKKYTNKSKSFPIPITWWERQNDILFACMSKYTNATQNVGAKIFWCNDKIPTTDLMLRCYAVIVLRDAVQTCHTTHYVTGFCTHLYAQILETLS